MEPLVVRLLSANATAPRRATAQAAAFDLYSAEEVLVPKRGRAVVKTDIAVALPPGVYGRVAPRSGLTVKHGLDVGAGVIDADYRGNIGVVLFNHSDEDFQVKRGDRVAQLILERIYTPDVVVVDHDLPETMRGVGGFGSTDATIQPQKKSKS
jgi:dUTP pyrophosphatase